MAPLIGILAGMGAHSTAPFVQMVVDECQRQYDAKNDIDFPPMMIYSNPTPIYIGRPLDHSAVEPAIRSGLQRVADAGAAFVAMPCNTAHIYYANLQASIRVPLLNMVDIAVAALPAAMNRPAVLAIGQTAKSELFQNALRARGFEPIALDAIQHHVDDIVRAVKAHEGMAKPRALWRDLLGAALSEGADCAIVACTDLNPARVAGDDADLAVLDATVTLARETVRHWVALRDAEPL